jgi:hypothetical protein
MRVIPRRMPSLRIFVGRPEVIEKILTHLGLWPAHFHSAPRSITA